MKVYTNFEHWNFVSVGVFLHSDIDTVGIEIETKCSLNNNEFERMKNAVDMYIRKFFESSVSECYFNGFYGHGINFPYLPASIVKGVNDDHNLYRILDEAFKAFDNKTNS